MDQNISLPANLQAEPLIPVRCITGIIRLIKTTALPYKIEYY